MNETRQIRAKSGTNLGGASAHNRRVMIDALRVNGALSRADLARATRLTPQTVSNIIEELSRDGLVTSQEIVRKGRGQPATPYRLVPGGAFAVGLQIDRHVTRVVVVNLLGEALVKMETKLPESGPAEGVKTVLTLIGKARDALREMEPLADERLVGLSIAMPGPFEIDTDYGDPWMMTAWQAFPLVETIAAETRLEVALQNDSAAAAVAEKMVGAAHGLDHAICIFLGYGLGAGLIVNGELYGGAYGNAGEIGMMLALAPRSADIAPLEHVASIASLCKALDLDPADPGLFDAIAAAIASDDARMLAWLDSAAERLRWTVQLLESTFDPQTIILCGSAPRSLLEALVVRMHPLLPSVSERRERFPQERLRPGLGDRWAVALGAAAEPISRAFDPRFSAILKSRP